MEVLNDQLEIFCILNRIDFYIEPNYALNSTRIRFKKDGKVRSYMISNNDLLMLSTIDLYTTSIIKELKENFNIRG